MAIIDEFLIKAPVSRTIQNATARTVQMMRNVNCHDDFFTEEFPNRVRCNSENDIFTIEMIIHPYRRVVCLGPKPKVFKMHMTF